MKQATFTAVFIMALNGLVTIVSTKKFSTQHYRIIKHPARFFERRPHVLKKFNEFYKKNLKVDGVLTIPNLSEKEYLVQCNENLSTEPFKIFDLFKFKIKFNSNERKSFVIVIDLGGKMKQFEN